jgi:hypothetical protein
MTNPFRGIRSLPLVLVGLCLWCLAGEATEPELEEFSWRSSFARVEWALVDEGPRDASFLEFRTRLHTIIVQKDVSSLMSVVAQDVLVSFEGDGGRDEFRTHWGLDAEARKSRIWVEFAYILRLGGCFTESEETSTSEKARFVAPYIACETPKKVRDLLLDDWELGVIVGSNVNVRREPSSTAKTIEQVSYECVRFADHERDATDPTLERIGPESFPWWKVELASGNSGYVWGKYVRSPLDYRVGFAKVHGEWKIASFVAGD